jgi:glycolate oxidase
MPLADVVRQLRKALGPDVVLDRPEDLLLYEYDAGVDTGVPGAVAFPTSTEHVSLIVRLASQHGISVVPRGAGTGLSGGAISRNGGIVLVFSRMNRILAIDAVNRRAEVQPGVVNLDLSEAAAKHGLYFAPDPSSQKACTIGGNVAENSGGPHTLAYGVTVNHVCGLEVVLADGSVVRFGGRINDGPGYDLAGFFTGSEGTIGIATRIVVKLLPLPESIATLLAIFDRVEDGANTVVEITRQGITPTALEMFDGLTLRTVEEATHAGYPMDAAAVLLIELEGLRESVEEQAEAVLAVCNGQRAREVRRAKDETERALLWKGRKNAFACIGRLAPAYYTQDGVVPRTKIPQTLDHIHKVSERFGLRIANIFHAGDGNMHPAVLFDPRDPEQRRRVVEAGADILAYCVSVGGTITGEHGIGMEKIDLMPLLFSETDIDVMKSLRNAFNPNSVLNPQKIFPTTKFCRETTGASRHPALKDGL